MKAILIPGGIFPATHIRNSDGTRWHLREIPAGYNGPTADAADFTPLPTRPSPVPSTVPLWAFREVLMDDGLLAPVLAAVQTDPRVLNFLEYGNFVDRASPALATLAAQLGKTDAEVDEFFRRAADKRL